MTDFRFNLQYANGKHTVDRPDIGTMEVVSAWTHDRVLQENADLRAKLEAAESRLNALRVTKKNLQQERDNLQAQLQKVEEDKYIALTYCREANKTMTDNDKQIADLQAQVGVLRETLGFITKSETIGYVKMIAESALELTPAEARERVRGLVEALEFYANPSNYEHYFDTCSEVDNDEGTVAKDALAKYRGGATK